MVYKAIERATGEIVAIKHVRVHLYHIISTTMRRCITDTAPRLTSSPAKTIFKKFNKKYPSSAPAPHNSSPNTKSHFCAATSYGLSWSTWAAAHVLTSYVFTNSHLHSKTTTPLLQLQTSC